MNELRNTGGDRKNTLAVIAATIAAAAVVVLAANSGGWRSKTLASDFGGEISAAPVFSIKGYSGYPNFQAPECFFIDEFADKIYIIDSVGRRIHVYGANGAEAETHPVEGDLKGIQSMVVYKDNIYMLHAAGIATLDIRKWKQSGMDLPAEIFKKAGFSKLLVNSEGLMFIADTRSGYIYTYDINEGGEGVRALEVESEKGGARKKFKNLADLHIDEWDNIYTLFSGGGKIDKYDSKKRFAGNLLKSHSRYAAEIFNPKLLASDSLKNVYVYDEGDRSIKVFSDIGFFKGKIEAVGGDGTTRYMFPAQIYIDDLERLYLLDKGDRTLKVFQLKGMI